MLRIECDSGGFEQGVHALFDEGHERVPFELLLKNDCGGRYIKILLALEHRHRFNYAACRPRSQGCIGQWVRRLRGTRNRRQRL